MYNKTLLIRISFDCHLFSLAKIQFMLNSDINRKRKYIAKETENCEYTADDPLNHGQHSYSPSLNLKMILRLKINDMVDRVSVLHSHAVKRTRNNISCCRTVLSGNGN